MAVLDLQKIDQMDLSSPESLSQLAIMIDDCYKGSQSYMHALAMKWEESIRFFMGDQYIRYVRERRGFEPIPETKYNEFIPRPVTNFILPIVQTLTSLFTRQKPNASVFENSRDSQDINAAKLAGRIQDAKWESDEEQIKLIKAAVIAIICGHVFRKDYWDSTLGPVSSLLSGPVGDNAVDILDPFRIIPDLQSGSYFIETTIHPISWIKSQYGVQGPGYTGLADSIKEEENLSGVMELHNRLRTSIGFSTDAPGFRSGENTLKGHSVLLEAYIHPTQRYRNGLMVVVSNRKTLFVNNSPYFNPNIPDSWHPYTDCPYQNHPFRFHGISLVEQLIPLQKRLNAIDSLIILNRMTMAMPQWLIPTGSMAPEGYISGQPGLNIPHTPGLEPKKVQGVGLPGDIYKERQSIIEEMYRIAGTNEVVDGQRPDGVNTASGLNLLLEQSFSKFSPFTQAWEKFLEKGQTKKLMLIASKYREPRPDFINRLKSLNKENLDIEIKDFVGADLRDNVSVRIEAGSSLPRSKAAEQSSYKELAGMGLFGALDPVSNPIGNKQFLEKFGVTPIENQMNMDVEKAKWVVSVLVGINRGELPPTAYPPFDPIDNVDIQFSILSNKMKTPEFKDTLGVFQRKLQELNQIISQQNALTQGAPLNGQEPNFPQGEPVQAGPMGNENFNAVPMQ